MGAGLYVYIFGVGFCVALPWDWGNARRLKDRDERLVQQPAPLLYPIHSFPINKTFCNHTCQGLRRVKISIDMKLRCITTALMALLCAGAWAQQQPARHGAGQRIPLQPKQENIQRQQADWTVITVSFDVKLPEGMSKENIFFELSDYSSVEYDPESGLHTTNIVVYEPFECTYRVNYNDYSADVHCFPKWGSFMVDDESLTIPVDMTGYHAVSFATSDPENWELSRLSISLQTDAPWADEAADSPWDLSAPYYLQPGQYTMEAVIRPTDGSYTGYYGAPAQPFTMGAEDAAFTFQVDPQRYHSVTIAATDREGNPYTSGYLTLTSSTGYCAYCEGGLGERGSATYMLHDGEYHYEITDNGQVYSSGDFTVAGSDTTVRAAMSGDWLRLRVRVTGDLTRYFTYTKSVSLFNVADWNQIQVNLSKEGDVFVLPEDTPLYLKAGEYRYEVNWEEHYQFKEAGHLHLEDDQELVIDFSNNRYATVTFPVYDPDGNLQPDANGYLTISDPLIDKSTYIRVSPSPTFFLQPGTYNACYQDDTYGVYDIPFTVEAGQQTEVPIHLERREYATVQVRLQAPQVNSPSFYYMMLNYCILYFGQNGIFNDYNDTGIMDFDMETCVAEGEVSLPVGQYDYVLKSNALYSQGTLNLQRDTLLTFDFSQTPYLQIDLTDEAGQPFDFDDAETFCYVYQDPQKVMVGDYGFFGFPAPGTYQILVTSAFYDEDTDTELSSIVNRTVTMGTESQVLTIAIPTPNADLFTVVFELMEEGKYLNRPGIIPMTGMVSMNGQTAPVLEDGIAVFGGLQAGTYPYTVQVDGYKTHTGTLEVNDQAVAYNKTIYPQVSLTRQATATGIGQVSADGSFRLFPTVATDALHILPGTAAGGEWTVRITSPHGTAVYTARHVLNAETVLPVGTLAPGLYLLTLDNGTDVETYKFVKR